MLRDKDCLNDKYYLVEYNSFNVTSELCGGRFQKVEKTWVLQFVLQTQSIYVVDCIELYLFNSVANSTKYYAFCFRLVNIDFDPKTQKFGKVTKKTESFGMIGGADACQVH